MDGIVRLKDLMAAEQALDEAEEALRAYQADPGAWPGNEAVDRDGRRTLHLRASHFDRLDRLANNVEAARGRLLALQRAFGSGGGE